MIFHTCDVRLLVCKICEPHQADHVIGHLDWGIMNTKLGYSELALTPYLIEMPFNAFANRANPDQAALQRAVWSESTLFAYGNIRYDPTLVDLTFS